MKNAPDHVRGIAVLGGRLQPARGGVGRIVGPNTGDGRCSPGGPLICVHEVAMGGDLREQLTDPSR